MRRLGDPAKVERLSLPFHSSSALLVVGGQWGLAAAVAAAARPEGGLAGAHALVDADRKVFGVVLLVAGRVPHPSAAVGEVYLGITSGLSHHRVQTLQGWAD